MARHMALYEKVVGVCTSESHPIYGKFMASLPDVIFEWDEADYW